MSAISKSKGAAPVAASGPRADDPRVVRTRAAAVDAARTLFLQRGYTGTTMEDIATLAGLTKRTLYNNYAHKDALFIQIVRDAISFAEAFGRELSHEFATGVTAANVRKTFDDLAHKLARTVLRAEVVALRRLLVGETQDVFPELAREYFDRAPGQVIDALATGFDHLAKAGVLRIAKTNRSGTRAAHARVAAAQFAYLVLGESLDRAVLVGTMPTKAQITARATEAVETFFARYGGRG